MEIVKTPIVDFFKYSLESAYRRGFTWVMCLLARDADAEEIYQQIKRYWDSLHDLTGKNILFVFAGKQIQEKQSNSLLRHEDEDYRALTNPSIRFVSDNIPTLPYYIYPVFDYERYKINELAVTHTRSITELRLLFGLSEKDIPSLVFIPTHKLARDKKVILKLQKENLYQMVKGIIESFEEPRKRLKRAQDDYEYIDERLFELSKEIGLLLKGKSAQNRFIKAKSYLDCLVSDTEDYNLKKWLQDAIRSKSVDKWHNFDHQVRSYLNQYLDLLKRYPTIEEECKTLISRLHSLKEEQRKATAISSEILERVTILYDELTQVIQGFKKQTTPVMMTNIPILKRFKISLSFPGEHRDLVEAIAERLAVIFTREQILYDKYHCAEFARPNLDTHLQKLYRYDSDLIVVFICADYQEKKWCGIEWRAIRDLMNQKNVDERIMFVMCGKGEVDGVFSTIDGYIDANKIEIKDIVCNILKRYNLINIV